MAKEKYSFSNEMKEKAQKRAELFNPHEKKNTHHILPKHLAKKYDLPTALVRNDLNAIALEIDLHDFLHGKHFTKDQLARIFENELSKLELEIDDDEIEWQGLEEDDFIFLAQAMLGIAQETFDKPAKIKRSRKKKRR